MKYLTRCCCPSAPARRVAARAAGRGGAARVPQPPAKACPGTGLCPHSDEVTPGEGALGERLCRTDVSGQSFVPGQGFLLWSVTFAIFLRHFLLL